MSTQLKVTAPARQRERTPSNWVTMLHCDLLRVGAGLCMTRVWTHDTCIVGFDLATTMQVTVSGGPWPRWRPSISDARVLRNESISAATRSARLARGTVPLRGNTRRRYQKLGALSTIRCSREYPVAAIGHHQCEQ